MNVVEACLTVIDSYHYRNTVDIDVPEASRMMCFAAIALGLICPPTVPIICIDNDMPEKTVGTFVERIKIITLRRFDGCSYDQGILVHELVHWIQHVNGRPYCEKEAITVQCRWLQRIGSGPEGYPTTKAIVKMTGDAAFARMEWLKAA